MTRQDGTIWGLERGFTCSPLSASWVSLGEIIDRGWKRTGESHYLTMTLALNHLGSFSYQILLLGADPPSRRPTLLLTSLTAKFFCLVFYVFQTDNKYNWHQLRKWKKDAESKHFWSRQAMKTLRCSVVTIFPHNFFFLSSQFPFVKNLNFEIFSTRE